VNTEIPLDDEQRRAALDVLLKEAEFLRDESLQCIGNVRKLALTATYIAGFSLPLMASFLTYGWTPETATLSPSTTLAPLGIEKTLQQNGIILESICIGVSTACAALLLIYVGTFKQIFNFARYFRELLTPSVHRLIFGEQGDATTGTPIPLFYWESWLQIQRKKGLAHAGDSELAAEPILIMVYIIVFSCLSVVFGYLSEFREDILQIAISICGINLAIIVLAIYKFVSILYFSTLEQND